MPLVRCPTHDIPYNSDNPRGCPACAREKEGGSEQAGIMRELARSSQMIRRPEFPPPAQPAARKSASRSTTERAPVTNPWVKRPPRMPEVEESPLERVTDRIRGQRIMVVAGLLIILSIWYLLSTTGTRFVAEPHPVSLTNPEDVRPIAFPVNVPVATTFSVLGTQAPRAVEGLPRIQRYSYGTDLEVDGINNRVYAITTRVPSRTWRGLQVGAAQQRAEGQLTVIGRLRTFTESVNVPARTVGDYRVYQSLDQRPLKTIGVSVRPPVGCFDVMVDIRPRAIGILIDGSSRYAVIGKGNAAAEWVVTQIRVVSRSIRGPYTDGTAC